jgi:arylsulfatase A-like enzyme
LLGCGETTPPEGNEPPPARDDLAPVIVVVIDTWRHDTFGELDADGRSITPRIDQLADGAVRFQQAISSSGWTLPSVASILTGTWPTVHKARGKGSWLTPITPDLPTAAEVFREAGYRTLAVANAAYLSRFLGLDRGFDEFNHRHAYNDRIRRADRAVDDALAMLDSSDRPPFLLLHLFDSHLDDDPPSDTRGRYTDGLEGPPPPLSMRQCRTLGDPSHPDAASNIEYIRALYHEEVAFLDQEIGRLVDELVTRDVWDRCLFVITADHGEEFWDHGGFEHGHTLYDELVHVPLIVKLPGSRAAGTVIDTPVRVLDLMPTLFDATDLETPVSFVGQSLLPLIDGAEEEERAILCESILHGEEQVAIRRGRYKLIVERTGRGMTSGELYDLVADPGETVDLSEQEAEVARSLRSELRQTLIGLHRQAQTLADPVPKNMSPEQLDMILESLQSLGYFQD